MELLFALSSHIACGYLGFWIVKFFYWLYGCPWTQNDERCFLFTSLCLGYFALIGFCLWIGCIVVNEFLRKVHLNIF